ncbi:hypothetical protein B0T20DRAFT_59352 [Sordaria brevicollis]|uniref:Secreted protein n=1 Tax=Sordaria brevicollis TaxID=83679 RepID=A0AAE0U6T3_SORBR|nr:hypothetical protein B0T20DRAFT_59352 [Sordaria brevicollis]
MVPTARDFRPGSTPEFAPACGFLVILLCGVAHTSSQHDVGDGEVSIPKTKIPLPGKLPWHEALRISRHGTVAFDRAARMGISSFRETDRILTVCQRGSGRRFNLDALASTLLHFQTSRDRKG